MDIIDQITRAVIEAASKPASLEQKVDLVKRIMTDLYAPSMQIIEELEAQVKRLKSAPPAPVTQLIPNPQYEQALKKLERKISEMDEVCRGQQSTISSLKSQLADLRAENQRLTAQKSVPPPTPATQCGRQASPSLQRAAQAAEGVPRQPHQDEPAAARPARRQRQRVRSAKKNMERTSRCFGEADGYDPLAAPISRPVSRWSPAPESIRLSAADARQTDIALITSIA